LVQEAQNFVRSWLTKRKIQKIKIEAEQLQMNEDLEDPDFDNIFMLGEGQ
jgi:hypothetical protein